MNPSLQDSPALFGVLRASKKDREVLTSFSLIWHSSSFLSNGLTLAMLHTQNAARNMLSKVLDAKSHELFKE